MREIVSFTIKRDLRKKMDSLRGDIPRSKFINKILESYIRDITEKPRGDAGDDSKDNLESMDFVSIECE